MKRFAPSFRGAPWPDGHRVLHVYLLPALSINHELARLVAACHAAMRDYPITLLDDDHLHATVEMVADTSADHITEDERSALAIALHEHLADVPAFQVTAGSPIANKAGALLDLAPDEPLAELRQRVQAAFRQVRGPDVIQHDGGRHHISLGYAFDAADSDPLQSALRRISPSHAPFRVDAVHLLDVQFRERRHGGSAGPGAWEIFWDYLAAIPLKGRPADVEHGTMHPGAGEASA